MYKSAYHVSFFVTTELQLTLHPPTQSTGDYYSCASLSGAPVPTAGIISRGIAAEGVGVIMSGLWGTGCGTTSYAENIGAIALTGVGSRAVVQCGAITMMILSVFAKFGKERCFSFISFYILSYAQRFICPCLTLKVFYLHQCHMQWLPACIVSSLL